MSFKISFNKSKWFLVYAYKPPKVSDECTLNVLSKFADEFVGNSNVFVFFGDINCDMFKDNILCDLCDFYDMKKYISTIAMDLPRAFDCIPHGLLVAKLHAYGVSVKACVFISYFLKDRMQIVKLMNTHCNWTKISRGVPQGSVLGSLLFNIFLNDFFVFTS